MHFVSYLGENDILPPKQLSDLRDRAALEKKSLFQLLYSVSESGEPIIPYTELVKYVQVSLAQAGVKVIEITSGTGYTLDSEVYAYFGGINEKVTERSLPLIRNSDNERIMLTVMPDDKMYRDKLYNVYGSDPVYAVASHAIWDSIWHALAEPALMQSMASRLSEVNGIGQIDDTQNSEARNLLQRIINIGMQRRASDVRFIPCTDRVDVQFRIDGVNELYGTIQKDVLDKLCNLLCIDGQIASKDPHTPIDGKVRHSPSGNKNGNDSIDLRISIIPSKKGKDLNIRYLNDKKYTFEELGMTPRIVTEYKRLLDLPSGLVVQVGPTGSGKSTTLYTGLEYLHEQLKNILTAEDPVEILMDGITQIDVEGDSKAENRMTFEKALTAALRHDPDVIVVGELRNETTTALAIRAANTGHLVLTSLHTNDAIGAIERLINLGIEPYALGEVLAAVMGQRLVRRLCPHCKEAYELDLKSERAFVFGLPNRSGTMKFYRAKGCNKCNYTGYRGRIAINEILTVDSTIRDMIQHHVTRQKYEDYLRQIKFSTMYHDGMLKAAQGITSLEEMEKHAGDAIAFKG